MMVMMSERKGVGDRKLGGGSRDGGLSGHGHGPDRRWKGKKRGVLSVGLDTGDSHDGGCEKGLGGWTIPPQKRLFTIFLSGLLWNGCWRLYLLLF